MIFNFAIRVSPSSPFGVPEEGITVLPAQPGRQVVGPSIRKDAWTPFGHGTLSEYRKEEDALRVDIENGGARLVATDNYWMISVEAANRESAYEQVKPLLSRLMHYLSVELNTRFSYEGLFIDNDQDEAAHSWPEPFQVGMMRATLYDLHDLRSKVEEGFRVALLSDKHLDKAYSYFESALTLRQAALQLGPYSTPAGMLWALAFLQLWKAITTILGDPSSDRDYQSRYRSFGLPSGFWESEVDPLYRIRNQEDVAHYRLSDDTSAITEAFGKAVAIAQRVLRAYSAHLQADKGGPT